MILSQLATQYTLTEINVEDCASIEQELLSKVTDRSQIIRTKVEDLTSYFDESLLLPSLIKMGPSCINI